MQFNVNARTVKEICSIYIQHTSRFLCLVATVNASKDASVYSVLQIDLQSRLRTDVCLHIRVICIHCATNNTRFEPNMYISTK